MKGVAMVGQVSVEDIVLINQLVALYGHVVDAAEWGRFGELFTSDAHLDYTEAGAPREYRGISEIVAFFSEANHPSAHHCVNVHVSSSDGLTKVASKFLCPYTRDTHHPRRWKGGNYFDVVERTADGWRFSSRTCVATWQLVSEETPERFTW